MKFIPLVWAGIRRKLSRSILILAQVIIAFTLFGVLQGLTSGVKHAIAAAHVDRLYVGSKLDFGFPLPIAIVQWLKSVPGVVGVAPRYQFGATYQRPGQGVPICATNVDTYFSIYTEDKIDPSELRAMREVQDGAIVGIGTMRKYGWRVGERVTLQSRLKRMNGTGDWTFDIVGTWADSEDASAADSRLLITHYGYIDESLPKRRRRDTINFAVLRIADPARATQIERSIDSHFANSPNETLTQSEQELEEAQLANFGDIDAVANRIVGAAFFVLLFATGALMMQSIRERTPELGVLKALGFSDRRVMALIFAETLVLCLVGAGIGLELGVRLLPVAREEIGTVTVPPIVFAVGVACAVALALASGAVASWRGLRLRVADALASR